MTMTAADLGVLGDLATALGIMQDGSPDAGWFGDPAARLKTVLSDDGQRDGARSRSSTACSTTARSTPTTRVGRACRSSRTTTRS